MTIELQKDGKLHIKLPNGEYVIVRHYDNSAYLSHSKDAECGEGVSLVADIPMNCNNSLNEMAKGE
jgi:hypothetical protein